MDFNKIVEYYERVASTRKRLKIIDIITEMFEFCIANGEMEELKKVIYLTQGRLVPEFEDFPKFGLGEKMIIEALVKYTGKKSNIIKKLINKKGDVGVAVQHMLEKRESGKVSYSLDVFTSKSKNKSDTKAKSKDLEINYLYKQLRKISETEGEGSQDRKINLINGILRRCNPKTAKYVINIILSTLRIGLADKTILDGLTKAKLGVKDQRDIVEKAYMIYPDLGEIAKILITQGLKGIQEVRAQVGRPIQMMLASRVRYTEIQKKLGGGKFAAEYKYDGERVQVHLEGSNIDLYSRRLKSISVQYPDVVQTIAKTITVENAIFEGEIVAMDAFYEKMMPFQVLSTRRRKYDIRETVEQVPVCLYCFDLLYLNGENYMDKPLLERRKALELIIPEKDSIQCGEQTLVHNTKEMVAYFEKARGDGAEGVICKSIGENSVYQAGNRGFLWIKLKALEGAKMLDSIDVVVIGASWGKGKRKGYLSTIYGAVYHKKRDVFQFLTRIGSGFSEEDLEVFTEALRPLELKKKPMDVKCRDEPDIWIQPQIVIEIIGDELTVSNKADAGTTLNNEEGYGLRFPVYQRTRDEKGPYDVTTTQEIIQLYKNQFN